MSLQVAVDEEAALRETADAVRQTFGDVVFAIRTPRKHKEDLVIVAQSGLDDKPQKMLVKGLPKQRYRECVPKQGVDER